jgi:EamA domain-containing membrane protein RarD
LIISILIGKFLLKEKTTTIENMGFLLIIAGFAMVSISSYNNTRNKKTEITCIENVTTEMLKNK